MVIMMSNQLTLLSCGILHPLNHKLKNPDTSEGAIFARGACDDKGQMFMHIKAFEIMNKNGGFPCNIKIMIEGEEKLEVII